MKSLGIKNRDLFLINLIFLTDVAILLNIPFVRPILGFLFLSVLPGLLILQILKLNKIGSTEKFVLSVGLSISFLMFFGLLLNNLSLALGYESPLSTIFLLISFNIAAISLILTAYWTNKNRTFSLPDFNLNASEKALLIVPILFPALSIFGAYFMNTTNNNIVSFFLLIIIPIYVIFICFFHQKLSARIYPLIIFLISISLILMMAMRSNHVLGSDAHDEYYLFQATLHNMYWSISGFSILDACLSISLLPTVYQLFLNLDPEIFFNIFYVCLFSLVPLVVFVISKKYVGDFYGFLASIFFIVQTRFIFATGGARTNIAIFFVSLTMMILFSDKIDPANKNILFIVFMTSCMVSHYTTTYIFFFVLLGTFVGMEILSKKYTFKKVTSLTIVTLFFIMIFFWYSQVTEVAFNTGVIFVKDVLVSLQDFFVMESRDTDMQVMFGEGIQQKGIPHKIQFILTWLTFVFIGIGVTTLIVRYKAMSFPELNFKKSNFLREKFEVEYFVISLACAGLLVAMIAFPHTSIGYSMQRLFVVANTILSVFFVIGSIMVAKYSNRFFKILRGITSIRRRSSRAKQVSRAEMNETQPSPVGAVPQVRIYIIILLVLIPYFFCVTGAMYNMFGVPRAITLNSAGEQNDIYYVYDQDSYGAKWLANTEGRIYAADFFGGQRLISQGIISPSTVDTDRFIKYGTIDGYIYLRHENVVKGKLRDGNNEMHNMTDYHDTLTEKNEIYDSGCSKIYR